MSSKLDKLSQRLYFPPNSEKYRSFKEKLNNLEFEQFLSRELVGEIHNFVSRPSARPLMTKTLDSYEFNRDSKQTEEIF